MAPLPLFYTFHFYLFGVIAVASAIAFVTRKSPVSAALWLVATMFSLAVMYIMLGAHFIGAVQVIVYAGAIMVVFLFVIMLLNLGDADAIGDTRSLWWKLAAGGVGLALIAFLFTLSKPRLDAALTLTPDARLAAAREAEQIGAVATVAKPLFTQYLLAFEVTSILLLAAIVGAVMLGQQRRRI